MSYRYSNDLLAEEEDVDENFILRHWRGHLSLPKSWFLVGGLLSTILFMALGVGLHLFERSSDSLQAIAAATLLLFVLFVVIRTWAIVGIWRSAGRHGKRGGSDAWALIAKILLVLGVVGTLFQARNYWLMTAEYGKLALGGDDLGGPTRMSVVDHGRILLVEGAMPSGTWQAFRGQLAANPKVEIVHLNSLGGRIFDADRIAGLIRTKGLDTQVVDKCVSACTIVLLAGRNRMGGRLAQVGFHQPDFPGMNPEMRAAMIADNSRIYREAGIAQPFIDRVMATPPAEVWFPTYEELMGSGVLTSDEEIVVGRKDAVDAVAVALAREVAASKAQLPIRIDDLTNLVGVSSTGRMMSLEYRVGRAIAVNGAIKAEMSRQVKGDACRSPMLRRYIDAGATIRTDYRDRSGKALFAIDVANCG